jgi:hypothetical protein
MVVKTVTIKIGFVVLLLLCTAINAASGAHGKHQESKGYASEVCGVMSFLCSKTITSAFDSKGQLWRVWTYEQRIYFSQSSDSGKNFNSPSMVESVNEKISSRGENRIKIGFDGHNGVYLSWASPREKRFTADVRFSYSSDGGQSFSAPITINDDNLLAGHSFNEMQVSAEGMVSIVWLDGRKKAIERAAGKEPTFPGSSLYLASANPSKGDFTFSNRSLVSNTCQCCRVALTTNTKGELSVLWRQIYRKNTREFALLTINGKSEAKRVSYDEWQIDGCPHQGGALSIDDRNRYHMVWFNQGEKGKGIFYSKTDNEGETLAKPLSIGDFSKQAAHPHLVHLDDRIDIVWMQTAQNKTQLWHLRSDDRGVSFGEAKMIVETDVTSDRPFLLANGEQIVVSWLQPNRQHLVKIL